MASLLLGLASVLVALAHAGDAGARDATAPESARAVRRIKVSDRGIEITTSGGEVRSRPGADSGDVVTDVGPNDRESGGVRVVGPGVVLDVSQEDMVRVFADAYVPAGERVNGDVVAVFGSVQVEGEVAGDVVAVLGSVRLAPGAVVGGDAVAVGGGLEKPAGATVHGESVSLGFLPPRWGAVTLKSLLGGVLLCWLATVAVGGLLSLLFPTRMLRVAATASRRTLASLLLGLVSGPLVILAMLLLVVTVIGIPVALLLPMAYAVAVWAGQLACAYLLGCRLLRRRLGEGRPIVAMLAGTLFVVAFFALGSILSGPSGAIRTLALFFHLLGALLVVGLSVIGTGAVLLSRVGALPADVDYESAAPPRPVPGAVPGPPLPPPAPPAA